MICILAPPLFQTLEKSPSDAHPLQTPALIQRKTNFSSPLSQFFHLKHGAPSKDCLVWSQTEMETCTGFGWDRVNFLQSIAHGAVFWICV